jgi:hypothetical protein
MSTIMPLASRTPEPMPLGPQVMSLRGNAGDPAKLRETFTQFVGETFYGQMIKSLRTSVGKPAYFHGGRAEEVFQGQLNQALAEHLTEATADTIAEPMLRNQFPHLVQAPAAPAPVNGLFQLEQLSRR